MRNINFKSLLIIFLLTFSVAFFLSSCGKEKETIAIIVVKYSNGDLVHKAQVRLHQDGQISAGGEDVDPDLATGWQETDVNGSVEFTFDLEAILNINVVDTVGNDIYAGNDIIRLLKGKSVTKIVEIN